MSCRLVDAGGDAGENEGDGIDGGAQGELELLPGAEGRGVPDVAGVEVGDGAEDALLLLDLELLGGDLVLGEGLDGGADGGKFER